MNTVDARTVMNPIIRFIVLPVCFGMAVGVLGFIFPLLICVYILYGPPDDTLAAPMWIVPFATVPAGFLIGFAGAIVWGIVKQRREWSDP